MAAAHQKRPLEGSSSRPQVGQAIHGTPTVVGLIVRRCSYRIPTPTLDNTDRQRELHKETCNYNIIVVIIVIIKIIIVIIIVIKAIVVVIVRIIKVIVGDS